MAKINVKTPSRLHITLIDLHGGLGRVDGGIGVSLRSPNIEVETTPYNGLKTSGFKRNFTFRLAQRFYRHYSIKPGASIRVNRMIPEHVGLGSGTQLALAVASSLAELHGIRTGVRELAYTMNRGGTSGIGIAAFEGGGGFILDGGHRLGPEENKKSFLPSRASKAPPPPILARYNFPEDWFFVVAIPQTRRGRSGRAEVDAFQSHCPIPSSEVSKLSRIILLKILPSVTERNIAGLGSALTAIQKIGFKKVEFKLQDPIVKKIIDFMITNHAAGGGMSSFGPAVYGLVSSERRAKNLVSSVEEFLNGRGGGFVFYERAQNRGAFIKKES